MVKFAADLNHRYAAPLYVDISQKIYRADPNSEENLGIKSPLEMNWELDPELMSDQGGGVTIDEETGENLGIVLKKTFIGKIPIMLRSTFCTLSTLSESDMTDLGECPYDQVGSYPLRP